jgi:hypothetical protein
MIVVNLIRCQLAKHCSIAANPAKREGRARLAPFFRGEGGVLPSLRELLMLYGRFGAVADPTGRRPL